MAHEIDGIFFCRNVTSTREAGAVTASECAALIGTVFPPTLQGYLMHLAVLRAVL